MHRVWRLIVGLAGAAGVYFAAWGAFWVFLFGVIAAQKPDPTAPDGDPCCATPDSWGEVASWVAGALVVAALAGALVVAALDVALLAAGVAFVWWALRQRWPSRGKLAVASALAAVIAVPTWYASMALF